MCAYYTVRCQKSVTAHSYVVPQYTDDNIQRLIFCVPVFEESVCIAVRLLVAMQRELLECQRISGVFSEPGRHLISLDLICHVYLFLNDPHNRGLAKMICGNSS